MVQPTAVSGISRLTSPGDDEKRDAAEEEDDDDSEGASTQDMERELAKLKNSLQTSDLIKRKENEGKRELNISSQDTLIVNPDQSTDQSGEESNQIIDEAVKRAMSPKETSKSDNPLDTSQESVDEATQMKQMLEDEATQMKQMSE